MAELEKLLSLIEEGARFWCSPLFTRHSMDRKLNAWTW